MRALAGLAMLVLAAGCHREPSFDERYFSAEQALRDKSASIDSDLATRESDAAAGEAIMDTATEPTKAGPRPAPPPTPATPRAKD
jgi:hypothetical protein